MAADDESSGLKIAVSAFITLSVILSVACYFLYASYSAANARLSSTQDELIRARAAQKILQKQYDDIRVKVGTETSVADPAKKASGPVTPR